MNWKRRMEAQILDATKKHAIGPNLKELAKLLLNGDTEFQLIYKPSREKFDTLRFTEEVGVGSRRIILKNYGVAVWKLLKP